MSLGVMPLNAVNRASSVRTATLTYVSIGTSVYTSSTTPIATSYPASIVAGNKLLLCISMVQASVAPTVTDPSGWTLIGSLVQGTTTQVGTWWYEKTALGSESGTLSISKSGGGIATILQYASSTGAFAATTFAKNGYTTATTGISQALDVDLGLQPNDECIAAIQAVSGRSLSAEALSSTGVTFGTANERADIFNSTMSHTVSTHPVSSGASSGVQTLTATIDVAGTSGIVAAVRLRGA